MSGDPGTGLCPLPLPEPSSGADKEERGKVLVIAGSREIPGAAVLAGTSALRAGAGKLAIATASSVAQSMAFAMPEARVFALPELASGGLCKPDGEVARTAFKRCAAVLIGPGMQDETATIAFVQELLGMCPDNVPLVLDALAMNVLLEIGRFHRPVVITPHAGEMAHLERRRKSESDDMRAIGLRAAKLWNATVALKGATTWVATPAGEVWRHVGNLPGLATSGSGDTLAGIVAGLAARGATLEQAAIWGVRLHAEAGRRLAEHVGSVGFLAREIADEIPAALAALCSRDEPRGTRRAARIPELET